jgi:hypothetical protein
MVSHMHYSTCAFMLLMTFAAGCSEKGRTFVPTAPSATPPPAPPTNVSVMRGVVLDPAFRSLRGAIVEVVDGPSAHSVATVADNGLVLITGTFDRTTRFRATADGHESVIQTCAEPCTSTTSLWINFYLRPLGTPAVDLSGDYTLTVAASASCATLPAESRSRVHRATLAPRTRPGTADVLGFTVSVHSAGMLEFARAAYVGVAGNFVRGYWASGEGEQPGLIEALGDNRYVAYIGSAEATLTSTPGTSVELSFSGTVEYLVLRSPPSSTLIPAGQIASRETCTAADHRLVFTRQ